MSDLITSLRALAAAKHDDLSVAAEAADEIERLRAERDTLLLDAREFLQQLQLRLNRISATAINDRLAALDTTAAKLNRRDKR